MIVEEDRTQQAIRYRLLDSIRAFALDEMVNAQRTTDTQAAHATWFLQASVSSTNGVRSAAQAEHLAFARVERANIDAALAWSAVTDPRQALRLANGFGWAWVVLGDSRGAQRLLTALAAAGDAAPAGERAQALLLAAWIEASTDRLELAEAHIAAAPRWPKPSTTSSCRHAAATTSRMWCRTSATSAVRWN